MKTILSFIAAGNLLAVLAIAQASQYSVTDLGVVGPLGQPLVITNSGPIAGAIQSTPASPTHAVVWYRGLVTDMSAALAAAGFTGPNSYGTGVNERGQVVGLAETSEADPHGEDFCEYGDNLVCLPFVSQFGFSRLTAPLPTLGGKNGVAISINNRGQVAGSAETATPDRTCAAPQKYEFKPVLWTNGSPRELSTVAGDLEGFTWAVNDLGQVAGASGACGFNPIFPVRLQPLHAIFWDTNGTPIDLGTLGGTGHGIGIFAKNLNNQGQVVGWSDLKGDMTFGAFIWNKATGMQPLPGPLPSSGNVSSGALAINDGGVVVGAAVDAGFTPTAVIWQNGVNGVMTDLNKLIPGDSPLRLWTACSITSRGEIIGIAVNKNNASEVHGYLLTPR